METDEGRKLAAKLLQQSAGIFSHLKTSVVSTIQQDPTPDLKPETLGALSALMLAQAQEIFVQKAIQGKNSLSNSTFIFIVIIFRSYEGCFDC